jgi:hypothetical protein
MRELDRFKVIQDVADGVLKPWRAAEYPGLTILGLTMRQISWLVVRLRKRQSAARVPRADPSPKARRCVNNKKHRDQAEA